MVDQNDKFPENESPVYRDGDVPRGYIHRLDVERPITGFEHSPHFRENNTTAYTRHVGEQGGRNLYASKKLSVRDLGLYMTRNLSKKINENLMLDEDGRSMSFQERSTKDVDLQTAKKGGGDDNDYPIYSLSWDPDEQGEDEFIGGYDSERTKTDITSLRLGECDVMNPHWQFNDLDDVRSNPHFPKFGRVYNNHIRANWPIVVFEPGRIAYKGNLKQLLANFNEGGVAKDVSAYIRGDRRGPLRTALLNVKRLLSSALTLVFGLGKTWTFRNDMTLYREYFNELVSEIGVVMGLVRTDFRNKMTSDTREIMNAITEVEDAGGVEGADPLLTEESPEEEYLRELRSIEGVPNGQDIFETTYNFDETEDSQGAFGGNYVGKIGSTTGRSKKKLNLFDILPHSSLAEIAKGRTKFIPFLMQKGVSLSETISNSTQQNPLVSEINQQAEQSETDRTTGGMKDAAEAADLQYKNFVSRSFERMKNRFKRSGAAGEMAVISSGGGRITLPEIFSESSFSRSVSIDFVLHSPMGDKLSIFENVYIPLMLLAALGMPRQVSAHGYTGPFVMRVFSRGLFQMTLAMVDSITISRGEDKNDRTTDGLFRTMKVSISLKDLVPTMMMSLDGGLFTMFKRHNDGMRQYMMLLGGLSLADQRALGAHYRRAWDKFWYNVTDRNFMKNMMTRFSEGVIGRSISVFTQGGIQADVARMSNEY